MTKPLTPAEQEELNRIGAETVTLSSATGQELGAFQGLGEASKGILSPSASAATALGTALSAPAVLWDYGKSIATGKQTTEAGDWMFKNVVDPYGRDVEKYWRPDPNAMGSASQTASGAFQLAGMVPQFFAHPAIPLSGMTISPTMDAVDQGVSTEGVYKIGALNLVTNGVGFALPAAWGGYRIQCGAGRCATRRNRRGVGRREQSQCLGLPLERHGSHAVRRGRGWHLCGQAAL
jgi:hypothetical protein